VCSSGAEGADSSRQQFGALLQEAVGPSAAATALKAAAALALSEALPASTPAVAGQAARGNLRAALSTDVGRPGAAAAAATEVGGVTAPAGTAVSRPVIAAPQQFQLVGAISSTPALGPVGAAATATNNQAAATATIGAAATAASGAACVAADGENAAAAVAAASGQQESGAGVGAAAAAAAAAAAGAGASTGAGPCVSFADLQQASPGNEGIELSWWVALQLHGPEAQPAQVDVAPVLQLCHNDWGDPDTLRALQSTITAADATHCRRTLQVLLVCMQPYVRIATMA
jgi:hypothetical protein